MSAFLRVKQLAVPVKLCGIRAVQLLLGTALKQPRPSYTLMQESLSSVSVQHNHFAQETFMDGGRHSQRKILDFFFNFLKQETPQKTAYKIEYAEISVSEPTAELMKKKIQINKIIIRRTLSFLRLAAEATKGKP